MGYRVVYAQGKSRNVESDSWGRRLMLMVVCFGMFLFLVQNYWPQGSALLQELLLPGEPDVTLEALEAFARQVSHGKDMRSAVSALWETIMEGITFAPG